MDGQTDEHTTDKVISIWSFAESHISSGKKVMAKVKLSISKVVKV